jgi:chitodextrinase
MSPTVTLHHGAAHAGTPASFSAGGSDPFPGGELATFQWTFGDGGRSSAASPKHTYQTAGTYPVSVIVTDNYGRRTRATVTVTVS